MNGLIGRMDPHGGVRVREVDELAPGGQHRDIVGVVGLERALADGLLVAARLDHHAGEELGEVGDQGRPGQHDRCTAPHRRAPMSRPSCPSSSAEAALIASGIATAGLADVVALWIGLAGLGAGARYTVRRVCCWTPWVWSESSLHWSSGPNSASSVTCLVAGWRGSGADARLRARSGSFPQPQPFSSWKPMHG
jgi:hypothetical protein